MKMISTRWCYTCTYRLRHVIKTTAGKCTTAFLILLLTLQFAQAHDIYAISGNNLIAFKSGNPGTITFSVPLSGVASGQVIEGLDFRPATGQLYALGYVAATGIAQVYRIDYKTAVATAMGGTVQLVANMVRIGMDFNPTVDRIRVTSFGGQNYRLHPDLGTIVATDGNLAYAPGDVHAGVTARIEAAAYTNSYYGGTPALVTATTIYYYDYGFDDLATSTNPNGGVLNTVGNSGFATLSGNGLDMDIVTNPATGIQCAYVSANVSGSNQTLYTLNLATGKASSEGVIGSGISISEMAVFLAPPTPELMYAITSSGNLISVNSNAPSIVLTTHPISGITSGQVIEGLDFRSATGELYALGYAAASGQTQVYTIDTVTGAATSVGAAVTLAANMTNVTMDFNPMADRIRVTSANGQNYRLVPTTGALAFTDGNLTYAPGDIRAGRTPAVAAVAYTNSYPGTTTTTIYYYDYALNSLALSTNPNGGVLTTVGLSGITPANAIGLDMDISSNPGINPNTAFLSASTDGISNTLYSLNLTNGNARMLGTIGSGGAITDFAVYIAPPTPSRTIYALSAGSLIKFNSNSPASITTIGTLNGITGGQTVEGLDFRPATLGLYAVGYNAATGATQVYTVDTTSGAATSVGAAVTLATGMSRLGVDFNPTVDRIRVTSSTGQNYRLNPINGTIAATDLNLNYAAGDASVVAVPSVNAVGYTNNMAVAATTRLYYYDYMLDALATTSLPNDGVLDTVGRSGIITASGNGLDMDIVRDPGTGMNTAFLSANVSGATSNLYTLNLATGEARLVGAIGAAGITEMAIRLSAADGSRSLPVSIVNFSGKKEGKNSQLSWTTQTEVNNSHFILERSTDGVKFTAVSGKIISAAIDGNSNVSLNYSFNDFSPANGANYYRLQQVDKDGRTTYSKMVQLQFNGGYEITMYPNPVSSILNINGFLSEKADVQIKLTDLNGRMINTATLKNQSGNWNLQVKADALPAGIYYVTILKNNTVIHTQSVQKK